MNLRVLAIGYTASQLGTQIGWIALIWWVLNEYRSPQLVAAAFVAYQLPSILSAPLIGTLLDRFNPKTVAVLGLGFGTCATVALAYLALRGTLSLPIALALVVLVSIASPASLTYRRVLIGQLVPAAELPAAYAMFSLGVEAAVLIGPALGGILVARWSVGVALTFFALGSALYLVAIAVLRYVPRTEALEGKLDIFAGAREIARRPIVLAVTLLTFFFFLAYGPLEVALPIAARSTYHASAVGYGLLWTSYAIGSVSGLLVLRGQYQRAPTTIMLSSIAVMWGILASGLAFAGSLVVAMLVLLAAGFFWSPYNALEQAFMQVQIPEHLQGSVFSMQDSFFYRLTVPLGAMIGGWALIHTTAQAVMFASGAACVVAGLAGFAATERARNRAIVPESLQRPR